MNRRFMIVSAIIFYIAAAVLWGGSNTLRAFNANGDGTTSAAAVDMQNTTDYSLHGSWLTADASGSKPVDIFYLYPTA